MAKKLLSEIVLSGNAKQVAKNQEIIDRGVRMTWSTVVDQGELFHSIKAGLPHGQFEKWCRKNTQLGKTQINAYMNAATNSRKKSLTAEALLSTGLKGLLECDPSDYEEESKPDDSDDDGDAPAKPKKPKPNPTAVRVQESIKNGKELFGHALTDVQRMRREIKKLREGELGTFINLQSVDQDLKNAYTALSFAAPFARCPYCAKPNGGQEGCKACHKLGWVSKGVNAQAPAELKRMAAKRGSE